MNFHAIKSSLTVRMLGPMLAGAALSATVLGLFLATSLVPAGLAFGTATDAPEDVQARLVGCLLMMWLAPVLVHGVQLRMVLTAVAGVPGPVGRLQACVGGALAMLITWGATGVGAIFMFMPALLVSWALFLLAPVWVAETRTGAGRSMKLMTSGKLATSGLWMGTSAVALGVAAFVSASGSALFWVAPPLIGAPICWAILAVGQVHCYRVARGRLGQLSQPDKS